eukprot:CAMPEP_0116872616 /NCGR_PEP_ID=MMETSP0463-20121206/3402_1 /TAXON_ID=181622 /ORGANISM="Strombidinopsis sp, Strain SopsisLIS2011" /LENGTH=109 /DNA_ID=CAMNT_0004513087 /DNA_START=242 /DNA_END=571 /DNA_ORIENTATION=-
MPPRSTKHQGSKFLKSKHGQGGSPNAFDIGVNEDKIKYDQKGTKVSGGLVPIRKNELSQVRVRKRDASYNYYNVSKTPTGSKGNLHTDDISKGNLNTDDNTIETMNGLI